MRLDHLLSRERAEAEMRKPIPGRSGLKEPGKKRQRSQAEFSRRRSAKTRQRKGTAVTSKCFSNLYRFQGSVRPHLDNRIAKEREDSGRPVAGRRGAKANRRLKKKNNWSQDQATKKSSYKEHRVDALAPYADEGRGKLRKATGSRKQAPIR